MYPSSNTMPNPMAKKVVRSKTRIRLESLLSPRDTFSKLELVKIKLKEAIEAIKNDDNRKIISCISGGVNVKSIYCFQVGWVGFCSQKRVVEASLLHLAVHQRAVQCTKTLLHLGASPEAKESVLKDTPLHSAVRLNDFNLVLLLLHYGANLDSQNARKDTPLHIAAEKGLVDILLILVKKGANILVSNRYNETAYHLSVRANSVKSRLCADILLTVFLQKKEEAL